jgi:hypothetical protein
MHSAALQRFAPERYDEGEAAAALMAQLVKQLM